MFLPHPQAPATTLYPALTLAKPRLPYKSVDCSTAQRQQNPPECSKPSAAVAILSGTRFRASDCILSASNDHAILLTAAIKFWRLYSLYISTVSWKMGHSHGGIIITSVKPVENSRASLIIGYKSSRTINFPSFSHVPFQSCELSNDISRPK
jgi:hypothetical protein